MTVRDTHGTELLEVAQLPERDLARLRPLTHAAVIARHLGRTLLVFNRAKQHFELPGGHIDPGEEPRGCAARELYEESAITCHIGDLKCAGALKIRVPGGDGTEARVEYGALYVADVEPSEPFTPNEEISQVLWWDGVESLAQLSAVDEAIVNAAAAAVATANQLTANDSPPFDAGAVVSLRDVTPENLRHVIRLRVAPDQERFVASNAVSIAQAYFHRETAWFRGIYAGETPIGFVMLEDQPDKPSYYLWRFMIDRRFQGRGFGARAIELVIDHVRTRPGATELTLSCVPGEGSPGPFYEKAGFSYTGDFEDGELIMRRAL